MSQAQPIGLPRSGNPVVRPDVRPDVRASIARAAQATGVDFDYLLAQAKIESSLNPSARAGSSSAAGLYQFTNSTWLATLDRHGERHGLDWAASAIDSGRISEPGMRAQIMAMRFDPDASALMAGELANDNREMLSGVLGREPDATELYIAHFLGSDGAARFLSALNTDPSQSAAAILPKAAAANRGIFFGAGGEPRSVAGVMDHMRRKVATAMDGAMDGTGGMPAATAAQDQFAQNQFAQNQLAPATGGPIARQFQSASEAIGGANRVSMAETLRSAFGSGEAAAHTGTPAFVRTAYAKLQAFGL